MVTYVTEPMAPLPNDRRISPRPTAAPRQLLLWDEDSAPAAPVPDVGSTPSEPAHVGHSGCGLESLLAYLRQLPPRAPGR